MTVAVNPTQTGEPLFYLADEHPHPEGYSTSLGLPASRCSTSPTNTRIRKAIAPRSASGST